MTSSARTALLRRLALEYQELNGLHFDVLEEPPTPSEFMRLVHISRPVVLKGLAHFASARWTNEYLSSEMGDREISIAVTPTGHADAITRGPDGKNYFVEPWLEKMTMGELLRRLENEADSNSEICYLQSQNGNLFSNSGSEISEFEPLLLDIPESIPWATEALGNPPEAVNVWIGNGASVTSIHSDPYENIYTVIRGEKHFTLFPPTEGWCLQERTYPHATYTRESPESPIRITASPSPPIRWSSVQDPTDLALLPLEAKPLHISLQTGDTLYLPVGWWHHVRQSGLTIALNWWYDVEIRGMNWVWLNFLRGESEDLPDGNE